jgi:hypothetical protein
MVVLRAERPDRARLCRTADTVWAAWWAVTDGCAREVVDRS